MLRKPLQFCFAVLSDVVAPSCHGSNSGRAVLYTSTLRMSHNCTMAMTLTGEAFRSGTFFSIGCLVRVQMCTNLFQLYAAKSMVINHKPPVPCD